MQYEYSSIKIPGYNVETWYIGNIVTLPGQYGSAQKFATLAGGYYPPLHGVRHRITAAKFRCVNEVLEDTLYKGRALPAQPRGQDGGKSAAQPPLAPTLGELASDSETERA